LQRVPELTKMLARCGVRGEKPGRSRSSGWTHEWEALHLAGWLHDCGKVTTPEYVVDKDDQARDDLQPHPRGAHGFEVLKREACIRASKHGGRRRRHAAGESSQRRCARSTTRFAFVATCNEGGEFMAPEKVARLEEIAARTWQRTLAIASGSRTRSEAQGARAGGPAAVTERLLADKPEHRRPSVGRRTFVPEDQSLGLQAENAAHLYNRGELTTSRSRAHADRRERYRSTTPSCRRSSC